ncbi:hypothetical protein LCGC14_1241970 [marine sediment metagenome]|uniref:Transposase n=1 Tax=marine sediment metagenome TaxID=412755 RepID=A0A0F9L5L1_9ZZZZ
MPRAGSAGRRYSNYTPAERRERLRKLQGYIRRARTLPDAKRLATGEGYQANTSAWLTAFAHLLRDGWRPKE